jgi:hypothetical protein
MGPQLRRSRGPIAFWGALFRGVGFGLGLVVGLVLGGVVFVGQVIVCHIVDGFLGRFLGRAFCCGRILRLLLGLGRILFGDCGFRSGFGRGENSLLGRVSFRRFEETPGCNETGHLNPANRREIQRLPTSANPASTPSGGSK